MVYLVGLDIAVAVANSSLDKVSTIILAHFAIMTSQINQILKLI